MGPGEVATQRRVLLLPPASPFTFTDDRPYFKLFRPGTESGGGRGWEKYFCVSRLCFHCESVTCDRSALDASTNSACSWPRIPDATNGFIQRGVARNIRTLSMLLYLEISRRGKSSNIGHSWLDSMLSAPLNLKGCQISHLAFLYKF